LFELAAGTVTRAGLTSAGAEANVGSFGPSISADGSRVAFVAGDSNFVPGDTNGFVDVVLRDRVAGTTELVSQSTSGAQGLDFSAFPRISGDGRHVGFESPADNLVELAVPASRHVHVRDTVGCAPTVATFCTVATMTNGCQASISAAGTPSASAAAGFTITVAAVDGMRAGLSFHVLTGPQAVPFGGGSSVLCAAAPL
jgi:hypothetical protein